MNDSDAGDICRQMDEVRRSLQSDVDQIIASTRTLADWRYYVRRYPWACLAAAAAAGFIVVPRRVEIVSPGAEAIEALARRNKLVVNAHPHRRAGGGLGGAVLGLLANAAARGVMGFARQSATQALAGSADNGSQKRAKSNF